MDIASQPTVLVVGSDDTLVSTLEANGCSVVRCPGPPGNGGTCPIVDGTGCGMVESAAGIVFGLDIDDGYHREILRRYRTHKDARFPLRVVADPQQRERHIADLAGLAATGPLGESELLEFANRVDLATMARRALAELARARTDRGGPTDLPAVAAG